MKRRKRFAILIGVAAVGVMALGAQTAAAGMVGQGASAPYTRSFAVVHRLRDGLIVEADYYLERDQALQAVGLRE